MTLVLTELNSFGIAMAADSAVTFINPRSGNVYAEPNRAIKLQVIPYLNAGISCWGMGEIDGTATDIWVQRYIDSHNTLTSLSNFTEQLAQTLNNLLPPNQTGEFRLGFHVAGYENFNGVPTPSFYHVHDGISTTLEQRGITINPKQVNANHDMPPEAFQLINRKGIGWLTRNGDYKLYAEIFGLLEAFFHTIAVKHGIIIPNSQNIQERAEYLVFQIKTVSEIYRLSNLIPGIGGAVYHLAINPGGITSYGTEYR